MHAFPGAPNGGPIVGPNGQILGPNGAMPITIGPNGQPLGPNGQPINQPTTVSRPGQLPAAQPQIPNPYAPPGRPGPTAGRPGGEGE